MLSHASEAASLSVPTQQESGLGRKVSSKLISFRLGKVSGFNIRQMRNLEFTELKEL